MFVHLVGELFAVPALLENVNKMQSACMSGFERLRPYHLHSFYAHNAGADIDSIGDIEALSTWSAWRAGATLLDSSGREKIPHYAARYIDSGPVIGQEAPQLHGRVTELRTRMYQTSG
ncbi:predicted protein [Histoplasma capsulatum H143]|uniref:Uncharacterized protein n=1 Tax=Ajellomyces capsulatus (strain H143) TaxID=544712 RepID=C6HDF7_AJECH|nr:predicted protein [Histoplasma capsulatum H143]